MPVRGSSDRKALGKTHCQPQAEGAAGFFYGRGVEDFERFKMHGQCGERGFRVVVEEFLRGFGNVEWRGFDEEGCFFGELYQSDGTRF